MIRGHSRPITKSRLPQAVLRVLSCGSLFCDKPSLTPSDKKFGRGAWGVFFETTETTETKETTAKQSIIRMIINFSVISVVPTVSVVSFLKKGAAF